MEAIRGFGVALATPFTSKLSVDTEGLTSLVMHCIEGGVDYLVVLGTTAETATLDKAEKETVLQTVIAANKGQLPLVIGMGGNYTRALVKELTSIDLTPFTAVLSVSPYYNKPTQEGIYRHYLNLADACSKPLIIYNVPSRTGSNVLPETVVRLAEARKNIIAVKEACGDLAQIKTIINTAPQGFTVLSGDDETACETILNGGHGVISVLGQAVPELYKTMVEKALSGDKDGALEVNTRLLPGMELIFKEGNPAGIKALLECGGIGTAQVRLPLVEASGPLKQQLSRFSGQLKAASG